MFLHQGFPFTPPLMGDPLDHVHGENVLEWGLWAGQAGGPESWPGVSLFSL